MVRIPLWSLILAIVVFPSACIAATHVIRPDGTGDFPTIQAAVNASVEFDIIVLTAGTFTGDGNRDIDYLEKPITIRSQDGDPDSCVIDCNGAVTDQHRGFYAFGVGSSAVLEGITVRDGWRQTGGAVLLEEADLTIRSCVFENCWAQGDGGAIYADLSSPSLAACTFRNNATAGYGGGVYYRGATSPSVDNCVFEENEAAWNGGGLFVGPEVTPTIRYSTFEWNSAGYNGGGISCYQTPDIWVYQCSFSFNHADNKGGGFYSGNGLLATVELSTFDTNWANNEGGGMTCVGLQNVGVDTCVFISNTSTHYGGAASFDDLDVRAILWRCRVESNHSTRGGGVALHRHAQYRFEIDECIFSENSCDVAGGAVCAIDEPSYEVWIEVRESTIYGNRGPHGSAIYASRDVRLTMANSIVAFGVDGAAVFCEAGQPFVSLSVDCCDVYGNEGGDWVGCLYGFGENGNISMDPLLCDPVEGDFHLLGESPCAPGTPPNAECELIGAQPVGCVPAGIPDETAQAIVHGLGRCWPNPFSMATTIGYRLERAMPVALRVYDVTGRLVRVLLRGRIQGGGEQLAEWDGKDDRGELLGSGLYFYRLQVGTHFETRPMVLMR